MRFTIATALLAAMLLSSCQLPGPLTVRKTTTERESQPVSASESKPTGLESGRDLSVEVSLTEMLGLSRKAGCKAPLEGLYTQVILKSTYCSPDGGCEKAEDQTPSNLLKKWIWPESLSTTFIAKVGVRPDLPAVSRQLVLLTHSDSDNSSGETRNAELLENDPALTPYFLVTSSSIVDVTVSAKRQNTLSTNAVRMLARVTEQATNLLAPGSGLATTLAKPVIRSQADNADKWLDLMFGFTDAESIGAGSSPAAVEEIRRAGELLFTGWLKKDQDGEYGRAAIWNFALADPRVSMFSSKILLCSEAGDVDAARTEAGRTLKSSQILHFSVSRDKIVKDLITAQDWYRDASAAIADPKQKSRGIAKFCSEVPGLIENQSFNSFDATAVLWAALVDTPGFSDFSDLASIPACQREHMAMMQYGIATGPSSAGRRLTPRMR